MFFVLLFLVSTSGEGNLPLRKLLRNAVSGLDIIHGTRFSSFAWSGVKFPF